MPASIEKKIPSPLERVYFNWFLRSNIGKGNRRRYNSHKWEIEWMNLLVRVTYVVIVLEGSIDWRKRNSTLMVAILNNICAKLITNSWLDTLICRQANNICACWPEVRVPFRYCFVFFICIEVRGKRRMLATGAIQMAFVNTSVVFFNQKVIYKKGVPGCSKS